MSKLHMIVVLAAATALSGSCFRVCGCSPPEDPGGFVNVSVRDQEGMPVAEARLNLVPDVGAPSLHGRTGPTGNMVAYLPAGWYSLNFDLPASYTRAPDQLETVRLVIVVGDTAHVLYRTVHSP